MVEITSKNHLYRLLKAKDKPFEKDDIKYLYCDAIDRYDCDSLYDFWMFHTDDSKRLNSKISHFNETLKASSNPIMTKNINYFTNINSGGKLVRGTLVNLGYMITGKNKDIEYSDDLALSIEIFQSAVLLHDDVLDKSMTRRGKDTVQIQFAKDYERVNELLLENPSFIDDMGNAVAISLGYVGLYLAYEKVVGAYGDNPDFCRLLREYDDVMLKCIQGGMSDMLMPFFERYHFLDKKDPYLASNEKSVLDIGYLKTASYTTIGPTVMGMIINGTDEDKLDKMRSIMSHAGIAFQVQDDILGVFADPKVLGKDVGSDVSEFKQTLLYVYIKEHDKARYKELMKYYGNPDITASDMKRVCELFTESGAYKYATDMMNYHYNAAKDEIEKLDYIDDESKKLLHGFIVYLECREY